MDGLWHKLPAGSAHLGCLRQSPQPSLSPAICLFWHSVFSFHISVSCSGARVPSRHTAVLFTPSQGADPSLTPFPPNHLKSMFSTASLTTQHHIFPLPLGPNSSHLCLEGRVDVNKDPSPSFTQTPEKDLGQNKAGLASLSASWITECLSLTGQSCLSTTDTDSALLGLCLCPSLGFPRSLNTKLE